MAETRLTDQGRGLTVGGGNASSPWRFAEFNGVRGAELVRWAEKARPLPPGL
jgi:hypothetical protein